MSIFFSVAKKQTPKEIHDDFQTKKKININATKLEKDTLFKLFQTLNDNQVAESLEMCGTEIDSEDTKHLAEALKNNYTLRMLDLLNNRVGNEGAKSIAESLKANQTLATLKLGSNRISDEGAMSIFGSLKTQNSSLRCLYLDNNNITKLSVKKMNEFLIENKTLQLLDLCNNEIGDEGCQQMCESLKGNQSLTALNLSNNQIGDEGCQQMFGFLKGNQSLTALNLSYNQIGDEGCKQMSEFLKANKSLTTLNLNENQISDKGCSQICEALKANGTLLNLHLAINKIAEEGALKIGELLAENKTLICVELQDNQINFSAASSILKALSQNHTITELYMKVFFPQKRAFYSQLMQAQSQGEDQEMLMKKLKSMQSEFFSNNETIRDNLYDILHRNKTSVKSFIDLINKENLELNLIKYKYNKDKAVSLNNTHSQERNKNTILHYIILKNNSDLNKFFLLDKEKVPKCNFMIKNREHTSVLDLLNLNNLLIMDCETHYNQIVKLNIFRHWPRSEICEEEIVFMRTGKNWNQIKDQFAKLSKHEIQLFIKFLYCPHTLGNESVEEKRDLESVLESLHIAFTYPKYLLFSKKQFVDNFHNYVSNFQNEIDKSVVLVSETKNNQVEKTNINKFILCLRSNLFQNMFLTLKESQKTEITDYFQIPTNFHNFLRAELYCIGNHLLNIQDLDKRELYNFFINEDVWGFYQVNSRLFFKTLIHFM
ncbi:ynein regulatory complex subunit [Anaeramoeba flamelloides]|uniref:Ynein regulatory complex subunit n=1 Tax=Anaeramoeba flamelloides TaxID=1746091 RepID=A0AAV7YJ03_9EUKA|nr:ynein regulatory complex subunit [Anaeramoeba flamelloides]